MGQPAIVAVLAGGRGQRLGGAKATTLLAGRPLISYPLEAARAGGLDAVVVAKPDSALPALSERVILEPQSPVHPLCGVLAALEHAASLEPPRAVVLAACDMPFLTGPLLAWLAQLDGMAMAQVGGRPQPLLSRCVSEQRGALREALAANRSLTGAIAALQPRILDAQELERFGDPERLCFSVNQPTDLCVAESELT